MADQDMGMPEKGIATSGEGENYCSTCGGDGKVDGETCPECGGSGKVVEEIAGG